MSAELLIEKANRVATVTINRPDRRNALSSAVIEALIEAFTTLSADDEVGVIVLTGAGDKAFCAGGDLGDQQGEAGLLGMHHARARFADLLLAATRSTRPIIARVNGLALGGGFGLMLACDLVVASEDALFGTPEIKVGLFPMMIMAVIQRNLGRKKAMELMLTGERIGASEALAIGAINYAVPAAELDARVLALAERIGAHSPAILRLGREAFYKTEDMGFEQALKTLQNELTINTLAEDAGEGIMAFLSKREPQWKGR
ncbi:MAG: enoyl-CoA hydratase/isomerase family protein [Bradymonadaceae bacterium]|nr:enoyl-CoA hydratase/isomerase family protein [Lujinxingiaceae bacterium]